VKIRILSDLHLEFADFTPPQTSADVIVLAGDIWLRDLGVFWAAETFPPEKTVYVLGNHEAYRENLDETVARCRATAKRRGIRFLENDVAVIAGIRFVGAILWSDFCLMGNDFDRRYAMHLADRQINDFRLISVTDRMKRRRRLAAQDMAVRHMASRQFIECELKRPFPGPTVIVTHFLPTPLSISEKFRGDPLNPYFCSDLTAVIEEWQPDLWVHGHTHESCDYSIRKTRVICNPRGYLPHEAKPHFCPDLIVDL
jgi:Icc-related predicted phosphoesterase